MSSRDPRIAVVVNNLDQHEVQIMLTRISRTETGVSLDSQAFQVDERQYFYPASSVKFPLALMAVEFAESHPTIDLNSPYRIKGEEGEHTLARERSTPTIRRPP